MENESVDVVRLLPIGSIVTIGESSKKIMIISTYITLIKDGQKNLFHYCGCLWPEGIIDTKTNIAFNDSDIKSIICYGNIEDKDYKERLILQNILDGKQYK